MSLLQNIRLTKSNLICDNCTDQGCMLDFVGFNNHVILKGELISPNMISDCIVFLENGGHTIIVVELKSHSLNVDKIISKLENGAKEGIRIFNSSGGSSGFRLYLVLLAKSYKNHSAYDRLRRAKVRIDGLTYFINLKRCGSNVSEIVR